MTTQLALGGTHWSPFQEAIFDDVRTGVGHTAVQARAGSGKTTTAIEALNFIPRGCSTLMVAFNKSIAEELRKRAPKHVTVQTLHAYGLSTLTRAVGRLDIDPHHTEHVIRSLVGEDRKNNDLRWALKRVVAFAKNTLAESTDDFDEMIDAYDLDIVGDRDTFLGTVQRVLERCRSHAGDAIDFDDMVWLPHALSLHPKSFDRVFVDECLPKWTPVLLADGSSKTIGEIVEQRLPVEVLAYDTVTGEQRACKVTAWHKLLNQKPLVKIRAKWSQRKGTNTPTNFVICTVDHPIWADGRWVKAGDVKPGMVVQIETSAEKSQVGKITTKGRRRLSSEMSNKNRSGKRGKGRKGTVKHRGGNGRGPTLPERTLAQALGEGWHLTYVVPTEVPRGRGYPTNYKLDIANPKCRVAVEVDGASHHSPERRAQDRKKERFLRKLGWTVHRVSNRDAVQSAASVAARILESANCPIDAEVTSVETVTIPDFHVYDITVEGCHNFYANGILVHNCQDLNNAQVDLSLKAVDAFGGRLTIIGDPAQAIYAFRGADAGAFENVVEQLGAKVLPLSITYRCARAIVDVAREVVPDFEAAANAPEGEVHWRVAEVEMLNDVRPGDFILSRTNAPLIGHCLSLLRKNVPATIAGRDIAQQLLAFVQKSNVRSVDGLLKHVNKWRDREIERLLSNDPPRSITHVEDKAEMFHALAQGAASVSEVEERLQRLFGDGDPTNRVVLSTTHKAKGLERDRVFVLENTYRKWPGEQEDNLWYVAVTRARRDLRIVSKAKTL